MIEGNRIHHCGVMPAKNHDHGIYVEEAFNTQILDNVIYDNADRGVQLYPDSQGTVIKGNIIDSNGEGVIFSGDFGHASSDNTVENNVITNSNVRNNVESWYPSGNPVGQGNVVTNNCIEGGVRASGDGGLDTSGGGFHAANNLDASPDYANQSAGDYTVSSSSPCAAILAVTGPAADQDPAAWVDAAADAYGRIADTSDQEDRRREAASSGQARALRPRARPADADRPRLAPGPPPARPRPARPGAAHAGARGGQAHPDRALLASGRLPLALAAHDLHDEPAPTRRMLHRRIQVRARIVRSTVERTIMAHVA